MNVTRPAPVITDSHVFRNTPAEHLAQIARHGFPRRVQTGPIRYDARNRTHRYQLVGGQALIMQARARAKVAATNAARIAEALAAATPDKLQAGDVVFAFTSSSRHSRPARIVLDRAPWPSRNPGSTILCGAYGGNPSVPVAVQTDTIRLLDRPAVSE